MVSGLKHVVGVAYDGISDRVYWTDVRSVCLIARDYLTNASSRVSDPDPQDPHVFALPGSGQKGKEMNE